jgi:hypothetical protein
MYVDKSKTYVGIVEENQDPKKLGRCRVRVIDIFDNIPVDDIPWATPWKDLNGNAFNVPEKGKILTVVFDSGNIYKPEYIYADHYNTNLEQKLQSLDGNNYSSMKALIFDHKTQIYVNDDEGLKFDYKFNNINITTTDISFNLKDNFGKVRIGTSNANQQAILGNHFLNWFDEFVNNLLSGPYLDSLGATVIPNPAFVAILQKYQALKDPKFLSHHVNIVDNEYVDKLDRVNDPQLGDKWTSTVQSNNLVSKEPTNYTPQDGLSTDTPNPTTGDLTTTSDPNGQTNAGNLATAPGSIAPSNNPDVDSLIATMQSKKYVILTRPYEVNIVGVRRQYEGMKYSNSFMDDLYIFYKIDSSDKWEIRKYKISTMPGYYNALEVQTANGPKLRTANYKLGSGEKFIGNTPNGVPVSIKQTSIMQSRGGLGILREAQYLNIYQIGSHCNYPAMLTKGNQKAYRDKSTEDIIKYTSQNEGSFGMLIHIGWQAGSAVNNWSEGCQVFASPTELQDFFNRCQKHKDMYGNNFNYTLMLERDLVKGSTLTTQTVSTQAANPGN